MARPTNEKPLIIVTGCSGLIGNRLVKALSEKYRIVGLDIAEPEDMPGDAAWKECDLTKDESVHDAFEQIRDEHGRHIGCVVHLAAYYDFSGEPSPMYDKLTVGGTRRLMDELQQFTCEQVIFSSSLLAMKPTESADEKLTEASPTRGEWDYPQSKLEAERTLQKHHRDIPVVVLRVSGVYDEQGHSLPLTQHIRRIYEKQLESYFFPGDPTLGQAFVHVDDLIVCFEKTIEKRTELGPWELFLIAEPDVMSQEELQDVIGDLVHGKAWPTIRIPKAAAKAGAWVKDKLSKEDAFIKPWMIDMADDHYAVEIARARKRLEWSPQHRLRETLPAMIDHLKRDPERWYAINNLPPPRKLQPHSSS